MSLVMCSNCGAEGQPGQLVCEKCGALLFNSSVSTVHMRVDPTLLRLRRNRQTHTGETIPEHMIVLHIRGMVERLMFEDGTAITLGRNDTPGASRLDLSRYGAHERGVSREHAVLTFKDGQLVVTDLNSVNGTAVNLTKLKPNHPCVLKSGDEIMLGTLSIIVNFDTTPLTKPTEIKLNPADETLPMNRKDVSEKIAEIHQNVMQVKEDTAPVDGSTMPIKAVGSTPATAPFNQPHKPDQKQDKRTGA